MAQGYITSIAPKETKAGTMYDFVIDGQKLGAGKFPPKGFVAGDYVNYEIEMRGDFKNLKSGSMSKAEAPAGVAPPAPAAIGGGSDSWGDRQEVISRQAAANTALQFLELLASQDALPMPAKVTKDRKADVLEAILQEYIAKFYYIATRKEYVAAEQPEVDLSSMEEKENWTE